MYKYIDSYIFCAKCFYPFLGQPHSFTVTVHPVDNFPADIYFLMDQSFSMNDDLENLRNVASQLGKSIMHDYAMII